MINIRRINKEEIGQFYEVFSSVLKEGFPEYSSELVNFFLTKDFPRSSFAKKLKENEWWGIAAFAKKKTVGFLVFDKPYGGVSYCLWLAVVKEFRGKGIGRILLEGWEKEVLQQGGHKLMLITQSEKNRGFYRKCSFKEEGFEEKSWFGLDARIFGKVISRPKPEVFLK